MQETPTKEKIKELAKEYSEMLKLTNFTDLGDVFLQVMHGYEAGAESMLSLLAEKEKEVDYFTNLCSKKSDTILEQHKEIEALKCQVTNEDVGVWIKKYNEAVKDGCSAFSALQFELTSAIKNNEKMRRILERNKSTFHDMKEMLNQFNNENSEIKASFEKMVSALKWYAGDFDGKEGTKWNGSILFFEDKFGHTYSDNGEKAREVLDSISINIKQK